MPRRARRFLAPSAQTFHLPPESTLFRQQGEGDPHGGTSASHPKCGPCIPSNFGCLTRAFSRDSKPKLKPWLGRKWRRRKRERRRPEGKARTSRERTLEAEMKETRTKKTGSFFFFGGGEGRQQTTRPQRRPRRGER